MSRKAAALIWIVLVAIWGSTWLAIKVGLQDLPPFTFAGVRFIVAILPIAAIVAARGRRLRLARRDWGLLAATGLLTEIVHVTNVTGDVCTIVRAQEGTTALAWTAGDLFANLVTAGTLAAFQQASPPAATFNAPSIIAASGMPGAGTITISGTKANRYTVFASVLGTLTNSNGTPISPIVSITIRDGSTVLATITSNFQSSGVPTGYAGAIQFGGVVNVPAPVAGSTYTITATDTEGDGGSQSYANTMLTANAAALS